MSEQNMNTWSRRAWRELAALEIKDEIRRQREDGLSPLRGDGDKAPCCKRVRKGMEHNGSNDVLYVLEGGAALRFRILYCPECGTRLA